MRIALLFVLMAACRSTASKEQRQQACKEACIADTDAVRTCGELASEAETKLMNTGELQEQLARGQCQSRVLEAALACARACAK